MSAVGPHSPGLCNASSGGGPEGRPELDGLKETWIGALRDRNIDAFMEVYWPEAEKVTLQRDGGEQVLRGFGQIREQQILAFERSDVFRQPHYSEPDREFHGNGAAYHYRVEGPGVFFVEHFEFVRPEGRWAIMHQVIDLRASERPEGMAEDREPPQATSDFQAWADGNRNGMLEPPELREFLEAVRALVQETVSAPPGAGPFPPSMKDSSSSDGRKYELPKLPGPLKRRPASKLAI